MSGSLGGAKFLCSTPSFKLTVLLWSTVFSVASDVSGVVSPVLLASVKLVISSFVTWPSMLNFPDSSSSFNLLSTSNCVLSLLYNSVYSRGSVSLYKITLPLCNWLFPLPSIKPTAPSPFTLSILLVIILLSAWSCK